jgi:hypothetical protein
MILCFCIRRGVLRNLQLNRLFALSIIELAWQLHQDVIVRLLSLSLLVRGHVPCHFGRVACMVFLGLLLLGLVKELGLKLEVVCLSGQF